MYSPTKVSRKLISICGVIDLPDAVKSVVFLELKSTAEKKKSVIVKGRETSWERGREREGKRGYLRQSQL